ncbi:MAG: hypothetical protein M5R40_18220 [Anaerolineae bacterium]|nr:hypothetical protein [Anaerolineae bacterium]
MNDDFGLREIAEYSQLRIRATELLDRCLIEGNPEQMWAFVEQLIAHEPPRLQLLRELADDVQLRNLSLKEHRFDVRDRIVALFRDYGVDITGAAPPFALDQYHLLGTDDIMNCVAQQGRTLSPKDAIMLRRAVEASLDTAAQLAADIALTERLYRHTADWLDALNTLEARRRSLDERFSNGYTH